MAAKPDAAYFSMAFYCRREIASGLATTVGCGRGDCDAMYCTSSLLNLTFAYILSIILMMMNWSWKELIRRGWKSNFSKCSGRTVRADIRLEIVEIADIIVQLIMPWQVSARFCEVSAEKARISMQKQYYGKSSPGESFVWKLRLV